ncbi:Inactive protein RESTRICTED TEV MOVEMENT 2 [Linum perenne]
MDSTARSAAAQRSYEDFEPTTEWKREPSADTLLVYLPGFRKDQLKVQVTSSRQLRITGERPSGANNSNKWSRFKKEMPIGANYEANEIGARFDKGVLYVKHPKLIPNHQSNPPPQPAAAGNNQFPPLQKPQPRPAAPTPQQDMRRPAAPAQLPKPPQQDMRKPAAPSAAAPTQPTAWRPVQDQKPSSTSADSQAAAMTGQPITPPLPEPSMWKQPPPAPIGFSPADKNQEKSNGRAAAAAAGAEVKKDDGGSNMRRRASSVVATSGGKLKEAGLGVMEMTRKDPKKLMNLVLAVMAAVVIVLYMKTVAVKSFCKFKGDDDHVLL